MRSLPTHSPSSVAALDDRDPNAGNASHRYASQFGPDKICSVQFQHGPRGVEGSTPGIFHDDLLAILEDRLRGFQSGPFACEENEIALAHIVRARDALAERVAKRIAKGVLGLNQNH